MGVGGGLIQNSCENNVSVPASQYNYILNSWQFNWLIPKFPRTKWLNPKFLKKGLPRLIHMLIFLSFPFLFNHLSLLKKNIRLTGSGLHNYQKVTHSLSLNYLPDIKAQFTFCNFMFYYWKIPIIIQLENWIRARYAFCMHTEIVARFKWVIVESIQSKLGKMTLLKSCKISLIGVK